MKLYLHISLLIFLFNPNLLSQSGWVQQYFGINRGINSIHFIDENTGWAAYYGTNGFSSFGHIERTSNGGGNWNSVFGLNAEIKDIKFVNSQTGWVLANGYVDTGIIFRLIHKSTNSGLNYILQYVDSLNPYFISLSVIDHNNVICLKSNGTIIKTSNGGINWNSINVDNIGFDMQFIDQTGWIIGGNNRIYNSANSGGSWIQISQFPGSFSGYIHFINLHTGFIANENLYKSSNGGLNWSLISPLGITAKDVFFANEIQGWVSGANGVIRYTSNGGLNWFTQSMPNNYSSITFNSIQFINSNTGWCSGFGTLVYPDLLGAIVKTTNGGVTSINQITSQIPSQFSLSQNYPNPFNPATKIKFQIPLLRGVDAEGDRGVFVQISVHDILGREVAVLVNEQLVPGTYEVDWDGSAFPSGVYFYTITSGEYSETRKMVLLK